MRQQTFTIVWFKNLSEFVLLVDGKMVSRSRIIDDILKDVEGEMMTMLTDDYPTTVVQG